MGCHCLKWKDEPACAQWGQGVSLVGTLDFPISRRKMEKSELVHLPLMSLTEGAKFSNQAKVNVLIEEITTYSALTRQTWDVPKSLSTKIN
jgi:hypothetical protein